MHLSRRAVERNPMALPSTATLPEAERITLNQSREVGVAVEVYDAPDRTSTSRRTVAASFVEADCPHAVRAVCESQMHGDVCRIVVVRPRDLHSWQGSHLPGHDGDVHEVGEVQIQVAERLSRSEAGAPDATATRPE